MATEFRNQIEFKNPESQQFFEALMYPKIPKKLPAKVAYQKFKNGRPVFTLITRD